MTDDSPYVRPDVSKFLEYLNNLPGPRTHQLEPPAARAVYSAMPGVAEPPIGELAVMRDLTIPGPGGRMKARLFDARETRVPGPAMVFYHGGGFVIGDLESHASACAEIARVLDIPVIAIDYRLAPEATWPAAPDDAEAAARWVAESPMDLGRSVTALVLCGDSAGGNLTIVTAMSLRDRPASVPVIVQAPLYPAADMTGGDYASARAYSKGYLLDRETLLWFQDAYAADLHHARSSPLHADMEGMPPAVVVTASLDPIRDQGRAYVAALAQAGVPVVYREAVGNIHGFLNVRKAIPSSQADVAGFLLAVKAMIVEMEGDRVMRQAAGS